MKAVIYARVSSREQEETGYSLPAQQKLLTEYANKRGFSVVKVFSISESASGAKQRKVFYEMIQYLEKNGIPNLLCEKVDRLTRNLKDAVSINDWVEADEKRQIHFVKQNLIIHKNAKSDDKFRWDIEIVLAKKYIANLSEEVKKGQKEKIAQGGLPHHPRLGYMSLNENGRISHIPDPDKAPYIKRAFELFSSGNYSVVRLMEILFQEGLRSRSNKKVVKSRINDILNDPFYIGRIRWCGQVYEGKQKPLITKELFEHCQQILKGRTTPKYSKHFYQFQGLVRCKICDGLITWEKQKGIMYGHCNRDYRNCPKKPWAHEVDIEKQVADRLASLQILQPRLSEWILKALKESHSDEKVYHFSSLEELQKSYERAQNRLDTLYDDKLDGKIDEQFYKRKFNQYTEEKEAITKSITEHSNASNKYFELASTLFELSQRAGALYCESKMIERKRQILGVVFSKMTLDGKNLDLELTKPFRLLEEAIKATNAAKEPENEKEPEIIFELPKFSLDKRKEQAFAPVQSMWRDRRGSNP